MIASPQAGAVAGIKAGTYTCLAAATTLAVAACITVILAGLGDEARETLRFGFGGVERSPAEAAQIAVHNARVAGSTLLCAAITPHIGLRARQIVFLVLTTVLASSAIGIGIAIGAYGTRVMAAVAIHLPVEFTALALAGGAYIQACQQPLSARELAVVATATVLLLVVAAALETFVSLGGIA